MLAGPYAAWEAKPTPPLSILPHDEHRAEHSLSVSLNKAKHSPALCVSHPPPLSYPFPNSLIETFSPAAFEDNGALEFMGYIFQPPRLGFSWVQVSARCLCLWWITQSDPDQRGCFISMCGDVPISQTHSRGLQTEIVINLMNSIWNRGAGDSNWKIILFIATLHLHL